MSIVFIVIISTELSCETLAAAGATVTIHYRFTLNSYYFVPVVWWAALLPKLGVCAMECVALVSVPAGPASLSGWGCYKIASFTLFYY